MNSSSQPTPASAPRPGSSSSARDPSGNQPRRYSHPVRVLLTIALVASTVAAVYRGLEAGKLEQTSALFLGLPLLLGLLTVHLVRVRGLHGAVLRGNLVFLTVMAPLLGEGSICLIMAAPLFLTVSHSVAAFAQNLSPGGRASLFLALPVTLGIGHQERAAAPAPERVRSVHVVAGDVEEWRQRVRGAAPLAVVESKFLRLGFPLPERYQVEGELARIDFSESEGVRGSWFVENRPHPLGVDFVVVSDTTKIAHWLTGLRSRVRIHPERAGTVRIEFETEFVPLLHPKSYFVPLQRLALQRAHDLGLACWLEGAK